MADERLKIVIEGAAGSALAALREVDTAQRKLSGGAASAAQSQALLAARVDAVTTATSRGASSALDLAQSHQAAARAATQVGGAVAGLNARLVSMGQARQHAAALTGEVNKLSNALLAVPAAGAAGVAYSVKQFADLEVALAAVKGRTGATADEMAKLQAKAIELGGDVRLAQYSATDMANAMVVLGSSGYDASAMLGGLTEASGLAAAAFGIDIPEAAQLAADAAMMFNIPADKTTQLIDQIVAASIAGGMSAQMMSENLKMSGAAAAAFNRPADETLGIMAMFSKHALRGSDAGTAYKTMMLAMTPASDAAAEAMTRYLGSTKVFFDQAGNLKSMAAIAEILRSKLGGLSQEQQTLALKTIFGTDAFRPAVALMQEGAAGVERYTAKANTANAASKLAADQNDTLKGTWEGLKSSVETAATSIGSDWAPAVRAATTAASCLVEWLGKEDSTTAALARTVGVLTVATVTLGAVYLKGTVLVTNYRVAKALLTSAIRANTAASAANTAATGAAATAARGISGILSSQAGLYGLLGIAATSFAIVAVKEWDKTRRAIEEADRAQRSYAAYAGSLVDAGYLRPEGRAQLDAIVANRPSTAQRMFGEFAPTLGVIATASGALHGLPGGSLLNMALKVAAKSAADQSQATKAADEAFLNFAPGKYMQSPHSVGKQTVRDQIAAGGVGSAPLPAAGAGGGGLGFASASDAAAQANAKRIESLQAQLALEQERLANLQASGGNGTSRAASLAAHAIQSVGRAYTQFSQNCTNAVTAIGRASGVLSTVTAWTPELLNRLTSHPDRFRKLSVGDTIPDGSFIIRPGASRSGLHSQIGVGGYAYGVPGARNGHRFVRQERAQTVSPGMSVFVPLGDSSSDAQQRKVDELRRQVASLTGNSALVDEQLSGEAGARAREAERAAQADRLAQLDAALRAPSLLAELGLDRGAAQSERDQLAVNIAQQQGTGAAWSARADIAERERQAAADAETAEQEKATAAAEARLGAAQGELDIARSQLDLDKSQRDVTTSTAAQLDRIERRQREVWSAELALAEVRGDSAATMLRIERESLDLQRERIEAERQAERERLAANLKAYEDRSSELSLWVRDAVLMGVKGRQLEAYRSQADSATLAVAAEKARQGDRLGSHEMRTSLAEEIAGRKRDRSGGLVDAIIGGDNGRVQDILQAGRRFSGTAPAFTTEDTLENALGRLSRPELGQFLNRLMDALRQRDDGLLNQIVTAVQQS